eukprot:403332562
MESSSPQQHNANLETNSNLQNQEFQANNNGAVQDVNFDDPEVQAQLMRGVLVVPNVADQFIQIVIFQNQQDDDDIVSNSTASSSCYSHSTDGSINASEQAVGLTFKGYIKFRMNKMPGDQSEDFEDLIVTIQRQPGPGQFHLQFLTCMMEEFYQQFEGLIDKDGNVHHQKVDQMIQDEKELNGIIVRKVLTKLRDHMHEFLIDKLQHDNSQPIDEFQEEE